MQTLKRLWKNEYFQTALTVALILIIVFGLYYGAQAALGTEYPALAVASGSMLPTLNIGDLIIVQKIDPAKIKADPINGDILVFKSKFNPNERIVHRAIRVENKGGYFEITTAGDNGGFPDSYSPWNSSLLVGKVIARIPAIGNLPLLLHSESNMYILFLALIIILMILMLPFGSQEGKEPRKEEQPTEKKLFSKISLSLLFYIIINIVLLGLVIFSLWGSLTFWQPGASPQQATIRGMLSDMQYHKGFAREVYLSQGFLTYQINYKVDDGIRQGVPTFSWCQFFLIILVAHNAWRLYNILKAYKMRKPATREANV